MSTLVQIEALSMQFGGLRALDDVGLSVDAGQICALIGPNGAGKTTLFNCVSGLQTPTSGSIVLDGDDLVGLKPHDVIRRGVARTFQNLALCPSLSVLENVMLGAQWDSRTGFWRAVTRIGVRADERRITERARGALRACGLEHLARQPATRLPFGTLKRIELARAIAAQPRLLLIDEPAGGLAHGEVAELGNLIRELRDTLDLTVIVVEHHMAMVMEISDHVVALGSGRILAAGTPDAVGRDPKVGAAYLGAAS